MDSTLGTNDHPVPSAALEQLQVLSTPIWVFDLGARRITWANQAAVQFWHADSLDQLRERDLGKDLSLASDGRLRGYAQRLGKEVRITEQWTFYPGSRPVTVLCSFTQTGSTSG